MEKAKESEQQVTEEQIKMVLSQKFLEAVQVAEQQVSYNFFIYLMFIAYIYCCAYLITRSMSYVRFINNLAAQLTQSKLH